MNTRTCTQQLATLPPTGKKLIMEGGGGGDSAAVSLLPVDAEDETPDSAVIYCCAGATCGSGSVEAHNTPLHSNLAHMASMEQDSHLIL